MPRSAARKAAAYPPGPPPTTAMRTFDMSAISIFLTLDLLFFLTLNREKERLLESFRDPAEEACCVSAINQAMIVRK